MRTLVSLISIVMLVAPAPAQRTLTARDPNRVEKTYRYLVFGPEISAYDPQFRQKKDSIIDWCQYMDGYFSGDRSYEGVEVGLCITKALLGGGEGKWPKDPPPIITSRTKVLCLDTQDAWDCYKANR